MDEEKRSNHRMAQLSSVRVRGTTSIVGGNDPLVIIDGVTSGLFQRVHIVNYLRETLAACVVGYRRTIAHIKVGIKGSGFMGGREYNISAYIYGPQDIKLNVQAASWVNGGDIEIGEE